MQGFGLPQWIQGNGVVPRLCMLGMSAGTLFMAVGWIQIVAGELVGCLQVCLYNKNSPLSFVDKAHASVLHLPPNKLQLLICRMSVYCNELSMVTLGFLQHAYRS